MHVKSEDLPDLVYISMSAKWFWNIYLPLEIIFLVFLTAELVIVFGKVSQQLRL